jgi:hypothetical protein
MSHFYGTIKGTRGKATRCGDKRSGLRTVAASWSGAVVVELYQDDLGRDCFHVAQCPWQGSGVNEVLATGAIGERAPDLIAAAPRMLAVLKEELSALYLWEACTLPDDVRQGINISIDKIERAIAEGEQTAKHTPAALIAAAPDLLAALEAAEGVVHWARDQGADIRAVHKMILAALAKARGEEQP